MRLVRRGPQPAPMRLDDRAADRQSHTHAAGLGGVEGAEELVNRVRLDTDAGVVYRYHQLIALVWPRSNDQLPQPIADGRHGLDAVHDEIEDHLLQLYAIRKRLGQLRGELQLQRHLMPEQLGPYEGHNVADHAVDVQASLVARTLRRQLADSLDYLRRPVAVRHHG